jgi:hypothetical protein
MYTIIDESTNKVLFAKFDNEVLEGQVAINKVCIIERENPFESEIFYNFETEQFYTKQ